MSSASPMRVAVSQRFLPHYRVQFYDLLSSILRTDNFDLQMFYSYTLGDVSPVPAWAKRLRGLRLEIDFGEITEALVWSPALPIHLWKYRPDVVIVEDVAGIANSLVAALYCRLTRTPYLIWGLGHIPKKTTSWPRRALAPLIRGLYRRAEGFVCYSSHAQAIYAAYGKPTFLAPNSALPRPTPAELERLEPAIAHKYEEATLRLLCMGVLKKQKRVDVLLEAMALLEKEPVTADIVGDGPARAELEAMARRLGLTERVRFHGPIYDASRKQQLLLQAHLAVIPGRGGLALQEFLCHGVPVICGVADGTEVDLVIDGATGYRVSGFISAGQIADRCRQFLALEPGKKQQMARNGMQRVTDLFNTDVMAAGVKQAITATAGARS